MLFFWALAVSLYKLSTTLQSLPLILQYVVALFSKKDLIKHAR